MSLNSWTNDYPIKKLIKIKPERIYKSPVKKKLSITIPNMKIASNPNQKLYDRFIPYGISQSLIGLSTYIAFTVAIFYGKKLISDNEKNENGEEFKVGDMLVVILNTNTAVWSFTIIAPNIKIIICDELCK